jgi:hypothetical protein
LFTQIFLKIFRITFKLVEKISPSVAGKWALRLFASPRRPARPEWEEASRASLILPAIILNFST